MEGYNMQTMINEPEIAYTSRVWPTLPFTRIPYLSIYNIEDKVIICSPAISSSFYFQKENRRSKIAKMRGSMKGLTSNEIEQQLGDLRNEWERSF